MPPPNRNLRGVVIVSALVAVVIGGFLAGSAAVGLLTGADATTRPVPTSKTEPQVPSGPVPVTRAPGTGFGRSREGAGGAAATHSMALVRVALADPATRTRTYKAITTRHARPGLLALALSSQGVLRRNLAGGPGPVVLRGAPLGYRIVSYSPARAVVDVWSVGIVGGSARRPVATWESTLVTLDWEHGAWRLDAFRSEPGLTPAAANTRSDPDQVLIDQDKYHGYDRFTP